MLDRVSTKPGRVLISPEDGKAAFYATMARADEPTQEGSPINKTTLLADATAAMYGLESNAVPDDVFRFLKEAVDQNKADISICAKITVGSYEGTGTYKEAGAISLTFDFVPKMLWVGIEGDDLMTIGAFRLPSEYDVYGYEGLGNEASANHAKINGTTVYWYSTSSADLMQNASGKTYHYVAIG